MALTDEDKQWIDARLEKLARAFPYHCECFRCGLSWVKRIAGRPQICPNCFHPKWDDPRQAGLAQPSYKAKARAKKKADIREACKAFTRPDGRE